MFFLTNMVNRMPHKLSNPIEKKSLSTILSNNPYTIDADLSISRIELTNQLNMVTFTKTLVNLFMLTRGFNMGLGDYLRGCIHMAQYAKQFNLNFKMDMSLHGHITHYLDYTNTPLPQNINIERCHHNHNTLNENKRFTNFVSSSNNNTVYLNSNLYYNKQYVTDDIKNYINSQIKFKQLYYDKAFQLCTLTNYNILHIRCTDENFTTDFIDLHLLNEIKKLNLNSNTIVISNNSYIKKQIHNLFGFYFINLNASHMAYSTDYLQIEPTIIEYIILSKSSNIVCFSYYEHGSGFSEQCAVLNNIPYRVICLNKKTY